LKEQLSGHPIIGDIRGTGLFWGIEIVRDKAMKVPFAPDLRITNRVIGTALKHGLFVYPTSGMAGKEGGDGVMVTPPFVIGPPEIDYIVRKLRTALDEVHATL